MAKDIAYFDPYNCANHVDNYFQELDNFLSDQSYTTESEKAELLRPALNFHMSVYTVTTSKCQKWLQTEEFSTTADDTVVVIAPLEMTHFCCEDPKQFEACIFQG